MLGSPGATKYLVMQPNGTVVEVRDAVLRVLDLWDGFLADAR
jgi:hypothetical protein